MYWFGVYTALCLYSLKNLTISKIEKLKDYSRLLSNKYFFNKKYAERNVPLLPIPAEQ